MKNYRITTERLETIKVMYHNHPIIQDAVAHIERIEADNAALLECVKWYAEQKVFFSGRARECLAKLEDAQK